MTAEEDIASVAGQLADLTRTVEQMANQLRALRERADSQQKRADTEHERAEIQQERIDLAARELTDFARPSASCGERAPRVTLIARSGAAPTEANS